MSRLFYDSILIDGVELSNKGVITSYAINRSSKDTETDNAKLYASKGILNYLNVLKTGLSVVISRGLITSEDEYLIKGYISALSEEDGQVVMDVVGRLDNYKRNFINKSYDKNTDSQLGELSAIFQSICEGGGITASVVSSGTSTSSLVLDKFRCYQTSRFERMSTINNILNWSFYDDYKNNYIRLEPPGYSTYSTNLVVGENIINIPFWVEDLTGMRNKITVNGAFEKDTRIENKTGDGSSITFTVNKTPLTTEVRIGGETGTLQVRGAQGASTSTYNYDVDENLKTFNFVTPPAASTAIYIKYSTLVPRPVTGSDSSSISYYGITQEDIYTFNDISTITDAETRLKQLLKYLSEANISTNLWVINISGLKPNVVVNVVDQNNPIYNGEYIINKLQYRYPEPYDIVSIGNSNFEIIDLMNNINDRLNALEIKDITGEAVLTIVQSAIIDYYSVPRFFKKEKATAESATLYWDHPVHGTWDDFNWGDDTTETATLVSLVPGNNTFEEYVNDDLFYDSSSSACQINTATNIISLGSGGYYITKEIAKTGEYTQFNLNVGTASTSMAYDLSADNKATWENIPTLNSNQVIAATPTDFYFRIRNTTATTATIATIKDQYGSLNTPAIRIIFS